MSAFKHNQIHSPESPRKHILTIALEDYFHAPAFRGFIGQERWGRFESRYEKSCISALDRLEQAGSSATFFVNCWVAQDRPSLLREVIQRGHEIALSGDGGPGFRSLTREQLREHLRSSRAILEDSCGHQVLGYRRSDVLLTPKDLWALEVLAEENFAYDSSLSPAFWRFKTQPWRRFVHHVNFGSRSLHEFPLSSQKIFTLMLPFAGGNYFRQYPKALVDWSIRQWNRSESYPLVLYFRLWDLDPSHPKIRTGSMVRNFRHYRKGEEMLLTLNELFRSHQFESIASHMDRIQVPVAAHKAVVADQSAIQSGTPTRSARRKPARLPVSIVIPCYNEQASIHYLSSCLDELAGELNDQYKVQYIFVDDGSVDRTWKDLKENFGLRPDVLLLRHSANRGVAAAIATGLEQAHEIACSMDCDCSYDPRELKAMLALLDANVDMVTASPYHPQGRVSNVPGWRLGLSRGASLLYRAVTGAKLHTFTACFRVYRRSSALAVPVQLPGFLGIAELAGRLALSGCRIVEHPTTLDVRIFGFSKMKIARTVLGHFHLLAKLAWSRMTRRSSGDFAWRRCPQQTKESKFLYGDNFD